MSVGPVATGSSAVELRSDTRRVHKLTWPGGVLPGLRAVVDGGGPAPRGGTSQVVRGIVQDSSGAVLATSAERSIAADNQVPNPGADVDLTGIHSTNGSTVTRDTSVALDGPASVKVVTPGLVSSESVRFGAGVSIAPLPCTAGDTVAVSAAIRAGSVFQVQLIVQFIASGGGTITSPTVQFGQTSSASWSMIQGSAVAPAGTTGYYVRLALVGTAATTWWVDRVRGVATSQVARPLALPFASPPSLPAGDYYLSLHAGDSDRVARVYGDLLADLATNLVPSPRGIGSSSFAAGWSGLNATISQIAGGGIRATIPSSSLGGAYFAAGASPAANRDVAATPGRVYTASVQYSAIPAGRTVYTQVLFRDAAGANIAGHSANGALISAATGGISSATLTAPPGAASVAVTCYRQAGAGAAAGDVVDIAMISVAEGPVAPLADGAFPGWAWSGAANASISSGTNHEVNSVLNPNGAATSPIRWSPWRGASSTGVVAESVADATYGTAVRVAMTADGPAPTVYAHGDRLPPGVMVYYAIRVMVESALPAGSTMRLQLRWTRPDAAYGGAINPGMSSSGVTDPVPGTWYSLSGFTTTPPMTGYGQPEVVFGSAIPNGTAITARATRAMVSTRSSAYFDGSFAGSSWSGATDASASLRPLSAASLPDAYADGASTALPPGGASTPGTMNLAMGERLSAAAVDLSTSASQAGAGALRFLVESVQSLASSLAGSGTVRLRGAAAVAMGAAVQAAGTLRLRGAAAMALETALTGRGTLRFRATAALTADTAAQGSGTVRLAGGADLSSSISTTGAGALRFTAPPSLIEASLSTSGFGGILREVGGPVDVRASLAQSGAGTLRLRSLAPGGIGRPTAGVASRRAPQTGSASR